MNICEGTKGRPYGGGDQCRRRPACQPGVVEAVAGCAGLVEADAARHWRGGAGLGVDGAAAAGSAGLVEMRQRRASPDW